MSLKNCGGKCTRTTGLASSGSIRRGLAAGLRHAAAVQPLPGGWGFRRPVTAERKCSAVENPSARRSADLASTPNGKVIVSALMGQQQSEKWGCGYEFIIRPFSGFSGKLWRYLNLMDQE